MSRVSPALAGGFLTNASPRKSLVLFIMWVYFSVTLVKTPESQGDCVQVISPLFIIKTSSWNTEGPQCLTHFHNTLTQWITALETNFD